MIAVMVVPPLVRLYWNGRGYLCHGQIDTIPFSQFEQLVAAGSVTEVTVSSDTIQGKVKDKLPSGNSVFVTARVDAALAERLVANGVVVTGVPSGRPVAGYRTMGPPRLNVLSGLVLHEPSPGGGQGLGGFMSIGKSWV